jgi:peroxiredoxin
MKSTLKFQALLLFAAIFLITACGNQDSSNGSKLSEDESVQSQGETTTIEGRIEGAAGKPIYLQYLKPNSIEQMDTVQADEDGGFRFEFEVDQIDFYRVALSEQNMCVLILQPGEEVSLTANAEQIYQTYEVEGSPESARLLELNKILAERDSIGMELQQAQMNQDRNRFTVAMAAYQQVLADVSGSIKAFIDEAPARMSSLAAVQNLDPAQDFDYFIKVVDAMAGKAEGNAFYDTMKEQVQRSRKLAVGSDAPEIALPQPNGETLRLSDLRGQYVLIDFWASWCGPCRKENPNVVRVYNKYHDKGFEILGVSLDKNRGAWLAAIEQDNLQWQHVSDLKYWQSEVVPEYQVQGIPLTYLIDPEGKIVAKNLRGPSLEEKLASIFNE